MDFYSCTQWYDDSRARDAVFVATDIGHAPWCLARID
jgi:polyphosphate kinase 2 (PPK2 family)